MKSKVKGFLKVAGVSALAIGLFSAAYMGVNNIAFAAATSGSTPVTAIYAQQVSTPTVTIPNAEQRLTATESSVFVPPNITIESLRVHDEIPASVMPMEEAAHVGAQYVWDTFGVNIDGMYVIMEYMDCWLRLGSGRWIGSVALPEVNPSVYAAYRFGMGEVSWRWGATVFIFTVDATSGERLDIAYRTPLGNHPPQIVEHDTQSLWESAQGRAIQAMNGYELAEFIGLSSEQLEAYRQEALALAQAHFNNAGIVSVELGVTFRSPYRTSHHPGIDPLLDTDADGNIVGTFSGIVFTATDEHGNEAEIEIREWLSFRTISVRTLFQN